MRRALADRLLAEVMGWSAEDVARERPRLEALSRIKYDSYEQFAPGERFVERLASWLAQFSEPAERQVAYDFVTSRLLFVSNAELQHLISMAYPDCVRPLLIHSVAAMVGEPPWRVHTVLSRPEFAWYQRSLLVLALSDGARLDVLRRAVSPELGHEQMFGSYEVSGQRAATLRDTLRDDLRRLGDPDAETARFQTVLLLDDFVGSGRTLLRRQPEGGWNGKLPRFLQSLEPGGTLRSVVAENDLHVIVLHYVGTAEAVARLSAEISAMPKAPGLRITVQVVQELPASLSIHPGTDSGIDDLLRRYYDSAIETEHTDVGGTSDVRYGFGACALPLVLTHNTPNNSISLLWGETNRVTALFPRVSRHQATIPGGG